MAPIDGTMSSADLRFWRGELSAIALPQTVSLQNIAVELDNLWDLSVRGSPEGRVYEYGAQLVLDENDDLQLSKVVQGHASGVSISLHVDSGHTLVGIVHTHPHETGQEGIAFSAHDFYFAINHALAVNLIHSGKYVFAIVRTEQTPNETDWDKLEGSFLGAVAMALARDFSKLEATLAANLAIARRYGFAFYYGDSHLLTRIP